MEHLYSLQGLRRCRSGGGVISHGVGGGSIGGDLLLPALVVFSAGGRPFFVISGFVMVIVTRGRFQNAVQAGALCSIDCRASTPITGCTSSARRDLAMPGVVNTSHGSSDLLMSFLLLPNDRVLLVMVAWSLVFELWFTWSSPGCCFSGRNTCRYCSHCGRSAWLPSTGWPIGKTSIRR